MKINDLKLLLECATSDVDGCHVGFGFVASKKRLRAAGLIEENPQHENQVRITSIGTMFVETLLAVADLKAFRSPRLSPTHSRASSILAKAHKSTRSRKPRKLAPVRPR